MLHAEARLTRISTGHRHRLAAIRNFLDEHLGRRASMVRESLAEAQARMDAIGSRAEGDARLERRSADIDGVIANADRSMQVRRTATAGHLRRLDDRFRRTVAEVASKRVRLAGLGAVAKLRQAHVRRQEQAAAIRHSLAISGACVAEARNAAASSLAAMAETIERRTTSCIDRLTRLGDIARRMEAISRLDALTAAVNVSMSAAASRVLGVKQAVRVRLESIEPGVLVAETQARRLASLGPVAERRHLEERAAAAAGDRTVAPAETRTDAVRQQPASAGGGNADNVRRSHDTTVPHVAPGSSIDGQRGSERRKAIAAAAWRLRRSSFPPQIRTATGFAIAPSFAGSYRDVDRFEAEALIQKIHVAKRAQMIAAVRRKIEGAERSPFIERDGYMRLPHDIFDQPLRRAVELASKDRDLIEAVDQSLLLWREREAAARKAKAHKERQAAERRERMQPRVQKVYDAIKQRIDDGRYPAPAIAVIRDDVLTVTKAVCEGRLAMRLSQGGRHFYCASEGLRATAARLADSLIGRQIVAALGKLTLDEPFETAELSVVWPLPHPARQQSSSNIEPDGANIVVTRGKGGVER